MRLLITIDAFEKRKETGSAYDQSRIRAVNWLHDNAGPPVAKLEQTYLEILEWTVYTYPSYSLDLATSDFYAVQLLTKKPKPWLILEYRQKTLYIWLGTFKLAEVLEAIVCNDG